LEMTNQERIELAEALGRILPKVRHFRWASGSCSGHCGGCEIEKKINDISFILGYHMVKEEEEIKSLLEGVMS